MKQTPSGDCPGHLWCHLRKGWLEGREWRFLALHVPASPRELLKTWVAGTTPEIQGLVWHLRIGISNKFSGDAEDAGPETLGITGLEGTRHPLVPSTLEVRPWELSLADFTEGGPPH